MSSGSQAAQAVMSAPTQKARSPALASTTARTSFMPSSARTACSS